SLGGRRRSVYERPARPWSVSTYVIPVLNSPWSLSEMTRSAAERSPMRGADRGGATLQPWEKRRRNVASRGTFVEIEPCVSNAVSHGGAASGPSFSAAPALPSTIDD